MSVDPDLAQTDQPYGYASDDPVNASDPTGLAPNCGPGAGPRKVVGTYKAKRPTFAGNWTVTLFCGTVEYGYRDLFPHIAESKIPGWSSFSFFIGQTLKGPAVIDYQEDNETWEYTAPAEAFDFSGNIIYRATFFVIVTANQQNPYIITAFARNPKVYGQLTEEVNTVCGTSEPFTEAAFT
jgi:hypothetical protein